MKNKVLIIAARPDDDILGCGGFMSRYRGIYEIKVLFVAEGSTCRFKDPNSDNAKKEDQTIINLPFLFCLSLFLSFSPSFFAFFIWSTT